MRRLAAPVFCILLLLGAAVAVALLHPEVETGGRDKSCGASAVAISFGQDTPPDIAEECDSEAGKSTLLAAICGLAALAGAAATIGIRERPRLVRG